ncbi:potassium channel family protein [Haloarcula nitratireducens]|uniref:TrkA family potassium uptake protein n=1 Tax=Haloarcula nitratireducens TaxID=2487749 RepID=A0AAW4PLG8_9EURY|nr:TrkA family potassium uptake protein [Halomicroarcula nitratireducens]MBX0298047.1 TrkA family potassium uptake protein [Halomicroarcula nitratireducens]
MSYSVRIVGGGNIGRRVADRLQHRGDDVVIIERDQQQVSTLDGAGYQVHAGDGTDMDVLRTVNTGSADIVIAATGDDDTNLLVSQLVKTKFDVETIVSRVNRPTNQDPFEDLGIETITRPIATARLMDGYIESPALTRWTEGLGREGDLQEVPVTNDTFVGRSIEEIDTELPDRCLITVVGPEGNAHLPALDESVERGQHLTLMGDREAVRDAMQLLNPDVETELVE